MNKYKNPTEYPKKISISVNIFKTIYWIDRKQQEITPFNIKTKFRIMSKPKNTYKMKM
jgi:hypothetical protein